VVTDASGGCTSTINVTVTLSGTIPATTTSTPTACVGVNNGSITVQSAGGTGPYTISLDGAAPVSVTLPHTFNGLSSGNHTIRVFDAGTGCNTGLLNVNVAVGPGVSGTASATATACPGVSSGTITVTAQTGTAPFTWSLDNGPFVPGTSPHTFNNVSGGSHTVTIRDAFNCSILVPVSVPFGTGVSGTATSTATSCPGVNNGTVRVTALTGTPPFTWTLDGGTPQNGSSPFTFNNVAAGPHTVVITDQVGCTILIPVTVTAGATPTANTTFTATACSGATNGSITIVSASGTPPLTFSLDGATPVTGSLPHTFTNVSSGPHTITVYDATTCNTGPIAVVVPAGPGVSGVATTTATSCPTANNGTVTADATAGFPPFTYQLNGGTPQTGPNPYLFTNVPAGSHTVVITDRYNCALTLSNVIVAAGPVLTASTSTGATSCNGANNGTITVNPNGGAPPFTFTLNGGTPQSAPPPFTFTNVPAGNHTVLVRDGAGCVTAPIAVSVAAGPQLTTTVTVADVRCNGGATGIITVTQPTIGTPPYEYSLNGVNWQSSNVFNGLIAGPYTVYYRESNGCQGQQNVTVAEPTVLRSTVSVVPVTCNGNSDGVITVTPTGGLTPYEYSIDGGTTWQSSNAFTVGAGSYTIRVRDVNGCAIDQPAVMTEPLTLTALAVTTLASCDGGNDGTISVMALGGNSGGYQYSLDGVNFQSSNLFNIGPGTYTITVRDNLGCSYSLPVTVGLGNNLVFNRLRDETICEGSSVRLNLVSNATTYAWTPATALSNPAVPDPVANPVTTTQYIVVATLGRCVVRDTVLVNVNPAPVPDAGADGYICYGQTYQLNASGGVRYAWSPNLYLNDASSSNPVSSSPRTQTYTLSILADANGCPSLVTDAMQLDVTPPIKIYTFPSDSIAYPGEQVPLRAVSAVPSADRYTWSPSRFLSDPTIPDPVFTAGNVGDSIVYKVTARSLAGCMGEAYVRMRVYKGPELYTPSGFTPNGDGRNDRFYPFPVGIRSINYFRVFNRWGQLVFSSNTLYRGWDGTLQGAEQPSGTYVWMAEGVDKDNKVISRKGTVTLIR
jgi:gliding motility-associated-like protein